ncbi:lipid-A-disaccharide synthase [Vibrio sp. SS-MA-C1-2]|uniref:lipid-A-disaccharide synthase n=1 Tax=Vibrio sp. SS-MA-C1-2 TaxID=2908646 RepID=UPI001F27271F|nr:lipid-A-disaccharide synthase [Vibrio sp. SS-MA-C1-2]UJF18890.1 lipid-A-disaccharide synthase [Vibrio sp. SS-MA-C1-2]
MNKKPLRIGIVAGEISGDILGAGLIEALRKQHPDAEFIGIGGPLMIEQGCQSWFEMEELAVMGIVEVLGRLRRILKIKAALKKRFIADPPDIFIGIDAPDFNLRLEADLKNAGIKTIHYVSPSVWAWRQKRIFKIAKATNLVLAFLPFEKAFYDKYNVPCRFIGHTMADAIPLECDKEAAKAELGLQLDRRWLAVLPGSRGSEVSMLAQPFIETCKILHQRFPDLGFVVPVVNDARRQQFTEALQQYAPDLEFTIVDKARPAMIAADTVLLASGTAALECMLVKRPMVVGYKMKPFTFWLATKLVKTAYVSLPNLLVNREIIPERLQHDCTPENLATELTSLLENDNHALIEQFNELHLMLKKDADKQAAEAVLTLIAE